MRWYSSHRTLLVACAALASPFALLAQASARVEQADGGHGFVSIFDGRTLNGWDGDPTFWRVENGVIVAESTLEKPVKQNTFLVWRGGAPGDFELTIDYRMTPGANSGVQYRSVILPDIGRWVMKGYQADLDGANAYTGQIYEERGRAFLAMRGAFARVRGAAAEDRTLIGSLGDDAALKALLRPNDWNTLHIIARGNTIIHLVNGRVMSALVDDDDQGRVMQGLLGLQIHVGPPMRIEFRNVWYKKL